MKKEIIIILIILITVISLNYITEKYTRDSIELLNTKLEDLKQEVVKEDVEKQSLQNKIDELYKLYNEKEKKLAYYIEHDELEKIKSKISLIKGNIETELYEETVHDIEDAIFILQHVEEKYKFILKNIF